MTKFTVALRVCGDMDIAVDAADEAGAERLARQELKRRFRFPKAGHLEATLLTGPGTGVSLRILPEFVDEAEIIDVEPSDYNLRQRL